MLQYPSKVDSRVTQAVAVVTFLTTYTILIEPDLSWIIYPLTADFVLRYLHPKLSPIARLFSWLTNVLDLKPRPYYAPPKRFAILIGVIFTTTISISVLLGLPVLQYVMLFGILTASFLQGFLDFCIGCELYNFLIKLGIIRDYKVYGASS